jgi:hypothetical protein
MLYITSLHLHEFHMAAAVAAVIGFVIFSIVKEKCDERKRA